MPTQWRFFLVRMIRSGFFGYHKTSLPSYPKKISAENGNFADLLAPDALDQKLLKISTLSIYKLSTRCDGLPSEILLT